MGTGKKEASRVVRENKATMGIRRVKGENFYRDAKKVAKINMFKDGKPIRNAQGTITQAGAFQSRETPKARIEPNRKWFGNTRVIAQAALSQFRENMLAKANNPYSVLLQRNKLPMSLLKISEKPSRLQVVDNESFGSTFGPKSSRKRPKLSAGSLRELVESTVVEDEKYKDRLESDSNLQVEPLDYVQEAREAVFYKGQSRRIWNELYKVANTYCECD